MLLAYVHISNNSNTVFSVLFSRNSNEKLENHDDKCTSSQLMQLITDSSIFIIKKKKSPFLFFPIIKVVMKNYKVNWVIIVFTPIKWVRLTFLKFLNVSLSWARQTIKWRNGLYIYKILMTLNEQLQNKTSKIKIKMNIFVVFTSHNTAFKNGQNVSISSKIQMFLLWKINLKF